MKVSKKYKQRNYYPHSIGSGGHVPGRIQNCWINTYRLLQVSINSNERKSMGLEGTKGESKDDFVIVDVLINIPL